MKEELSLTVVTSLGVSMAVGYKEINPTIIVIVKEFRSPAYIRKTYFGDLRGIGNISERIVAIIVIELGRE
jgi:hypothetical protein